jgi:hypothetical protein
VAVVLLSAQNNRLHKVFAGSIVLYFGDPSAGRDFCVWNLLQVLHKLEQSFGRADFIAGLQGHVQIFC